VNVTVGVEVAREVLFGIAPPVRADHRDLAPADRVPDRDGEFETVTRIRRAVRRGAGDFG
jgi:hypothetical protein